MNACHVSSTLSFVLSRGRGGTLTRDGLPPPHLVGVRYPSPGRGRVYPIPGQGTPHPDLAWGGGPVLARGYLIPDWGTPSWGTPSQDWGTPQEGPGTSHWGTPWKRHGTSGSIMGWRWGTPRCGQTNKLKLLPSPILRMRVVMTICQCDYELESAGE